MNQNTKTLQLIIFCIAALTLIETRSGLAAVVAGVLATWQILPDRYSTFYGINSAQPKKKKKGIIIRLFDKNLIFNKCRWKGPQSGKTAYMFLISCVNKNQTAATSMCMLSASYSAGPPTACTPVNLAQPWALFSDKTFILDTHACTHLHTHTRARTTTLTLTGLLGHPSDPARPAPPAPQARKVSGFFDVGPIDHHYYCSLLIPMEMRPAAVVLGDWGWGQGLASLSEYKIQLTAAPLLSMPSELWRTLAGKHARGTDAQQTDSICTGQSLWQDWDFVWLMLVQREQGGVAQHYGLCAGN